MSQSPSEPKVGVRQVLADPAVRTVILVYGGVWLGLGMVLPILVLYAQSFGVGYGAAAALLSSASVARLAFDLVAGPILDRYGERRLVPIGMVVLGVSHVLTAVAPDYGLAVAFYAVGGAGSAFVWAGLFSYILKTVPKDRTARTLGILYGTGNIGVVAGGLLGGVVAEALGLASPLIFYGALLGLAAVLFVTVVPPPKGKATEPPLSTEEVLVEREIPVPRRTRARMADVLRIPAFPTVLVLNLAYLWMVAAVFDTLVPLFGKDALGMSPAGIGVVFAVVLGTEFIVLYPAGIAADRIGRKRVLLPSLAGLGVMTVVLGWAGTPVTLGILVGVLGIASGYAGVPPAAMLADVVPEEESGTAVGMFRFCGDLGLLFGPLVAGVTAGAFGFKVSFPVAALPTIAALLMVLRTPETLKRSERVDR